MSLEIKEEISDLPGIANSYHELGMVAEARGLLDEAQDWCRQVLNIRETLGPRPLLATDYHLLGNIAQKRGLLDEADDWYRVALAIAEELGNRLAMTEMCRGLGALAITRGQALPALEWSIRAVTVFSEFPSPVSAPAPEILAELAGQLGIHALQQAWQQITGQPLPQQVRDYVTSQHNNQSNRP